MIKKNIVQTFKNIEDIYNFYVQDSSEIQVQQLNIRGFFLMCISAGELLLKKITGGMFNLELVICTAVSSREVASLDMLRAELIGQGFAAEIVTAFNWQYLYFGSNFTEIYSYKSSWPWVSIGSGIGNDLALNRHQTITWTNVDQDAWHHVVALGLNDFKFMITVKPLI